MATPRESRAPALSPRHLRRPRLTSLLDASAAQVILLVAPAGYGKTSLACEWLQGRNDVAWYRATRASADVAAVALGLAEAVSGMVPGAGRRLSQRLGVADTPEQAARPLAELLAEDLAAFPDSAVLVIDDYHEVHDSVATEEFMDWLLELAPALRLLVTSRRRPRWASARRMLHGQLLEITTERLAMTDREASTTLGHGAPDFVAGLLSRAQGWPALIGLASLATSAELPAERVSHGLFRYFADEVLRQETEAVQDFMLLASVPSTVTLELVRDELGIQDAAPMVDRLCEDSLLHETRSGEYVFHPLLHEFLRHKLRSNRPDVAWQLAARLVARARSARQFEEAFDLAIAFGNTAVALEVIAEGAEDLLSRGQLETVEHWLEELGPKLESNPGATLTKADVLLRRHRLAEAAKIAREIASQLNADHELLPRALRLEGWAAYQMSDARHALRCHERAYGLAPSEEEQADALWGGFLAAYELEEDATGFLAQLDTIAHSNDSIQARARHGQVLLSMLVGDLNAAGDPARRALTMTATAEDLITQSSLLFRVADLECGRARFREGLDAAERCEALCNQLRLSYGLAASQYAKGLALIGLRRLHEARIALEALRQFARDTFDTYHAALAALVGAHLCIAEGNLSGALAHADMHDAPTRFCRGYLGGMYAIASAALGDLDTACERLAAARLASRSALSATTADVAELIVRCQSDRYDKARDTAFVRSLANGGFLSCLVVAYRAFPPLLQLLTSDPACERILLQTLRLSNDEALARKHGFDLPDVERSSPLHLLTKRELQVLDLVCRGLTNAAIARELVIAHGTAKAHVRNVLKKLGVHTRLQAALMAREIWDEMRFPRA